ncbi:MAG: discoidin domain-containing protein [Desulfuromonadales bacterium]|nr:discoidin domain-containing protein [Desulfuromonadales bacterium]
MEPLTGCSAASCHPADLRNTHHATPDATSGNCAECHTSLPQVVDCESCHDPDYWSKPDANGNPTQVDALGKPLDARSTHHVSETAQGDCTACHTNAPKPTTCSDCHHMEAASTHHVRAEGGGGANCSHCHGSNIAVDFNVNDAGLRPDCQDCHAPSVANQETHHALATSRDDLTCDTCHSDAVPVTGCDTLDCHGASGSWSAGSAKAQHHDVIRVAQGADCTSCHSSLPAEYTCDSCHATGNARLRVRNHHTNPKTTILPCSTCHGANADIPHPAGHDATAPETDCQFCHANGTYPDGTAKTAPWSAGSSLEQHHNVVRLGESLDCQVCHSELEPRESCGSCHTSSFWTEGSARDQHHNVAAQGKSCQECHGLTDPAMLDPTSCESCHTADSWVVDKRTDHHEYASNAAADCALCHTLTSPRKTDCSQCHFGGTAETHHADLTGKNCDSCHTGYTPPVDCESCHTTWTVDKKTDHHKFAEQSSTVNCNDCHSSVTTATGCTSCHENDRSVTDWNGAALHHTSNPPNNFFPTCGNCHGPGYAPVTDADCAVCHLEGFIGSNPPTTAGDLHHGNINYVNNNCGACHAGSADISASLPLDCAECHSQPGVARDGSQAMHHGTTDGAPDYTANNCQTCHQGISGSQLDCAACHGSLPEDPDTGIAKNGGPEMHHATTRVDTSVCDNCHIPDFAAAQNVDCATCHSQPGVVRDGGPVMHHDNTAAGLSGDCNLCHVNASAAVTTAQFSACEQCHGSAVSGQHHDADFTTVDPVDCASCHVGIDGVSGNALDCAVCHTGKARDGSQVMHHGTADGAPDYAAGNCGSCHVVKDYADLVAGNECFNCHTYNGDPAWEAYVVDQHHLDASGAEVTNCAVCHGVAQSELDCATCHATQPVDPNTQIAKDGKAAMHHATEAATTGNCIDCHSSVSADGLNCDSCHATQPVLDGSMAMHHGTSDGVPDYTVDNCMTCHLGAEGEAINCGLCHAAVGTLANQDRHHFSRVATTQPCTTCHVAVNTAELDCATCHAAQQGSLDGSVNMHHNLTMLGQLKECATCHEGAAIADNDCSVCHLADGKPPIADTHHATPTAQTGLCSACHVGAEPVGIACANCHGDQGADAEPIGHHLRPEYQNDNCQFCHTDITLNGSNCESCHTSGGVTIQETHHATPLNSVGGDCSVCHQSVSSPDVCANCHASSPHHTTLAADYGLCEQCHTWSADKNENPQQGSCRQCHGQYMHGKNSAAPIHDYRSCFSCHGNGGNMDAVFPTAVNVPVFHAKPSRGVGLTNPAPGKGTFNLFYGSNGGKSRNEDRFGEREDWERLGEGRDYRDPGISYTLVQISEGGQTYQVPAFDNIPAPNLPSGGGSTGGGSGLSVCTSCHNDYSNLVACENSKWRDHQTLNRVDLATYQLAESTYLGSYCPDLPPEPEEPANLALNKSASASDDEGSSYRASRAVDGDSGTRWYARSYRTEWLKVDLGSRQSISQVVINWHNYYAREYDVEVSTDNQNWTRVYRNENGNGGTDTVNFSARDARYVRIECNRRNESGYSIYELEVYQ